MNLLLLLSALLSALSGVGQAVRGTRAPAAVCASVTDCAVTTAPRRAVAVRPAPRRLRLADAPAVTREPFDLIRAEPIFAGRRRE